MENEKKPAVRFKEFTDDWKVLKFGDVFVERRDKSVIENEDTLLSCAISGMFLNSELFSHQRGQSNIGYIKVKKGDLILSAQNLHLGNANVNLRFNHGIISPAYKVYEPVNCDPNFAQAWIKRDKAKKYFLSATTEGASACRKNVVWEWLYNQPFYLPPISEQKEIGQSFFYLDRFITLHQRKCDNLQNMKKACLEKMFPQNGSKVPKIRFRGFHGVWNQTMISDVVTFSKGNGYSKSDLRPNGTPIILYGRLYTKYQFAINCVDTFAKMKTGSILSNGNEVIVPASGETAEDIARAAAVERADIILGGDLNILHPSREILPQFLALSISNGSPKKELARKAQGKSVVHIHNSDIEEISVLYPKLSEQRKIVEVFRNIDNLIDLQQQELEKLQNIKKSLLEKMFV